MHDKELLEERKSTATRDLKLTIEYQKNEIDKLKSEELDHFINRYSFIDIDQLKAKDVPLSDVTDLPSELEQCQSNLMNISWN